MIMLGSNWLETLGIFTLDANNKFYVGRLPIHVMGYPSSVQETYPHETISSL